MKKNKSSLKKFSGKKKHIRSAEADKIARGLITFLKNAEGVDQAICRLLAQEAFQQNTALQISFFIISSVSAMVAKI